MSDASSLVLLSSENPWPGLRAFTESDQPFFFGREQETAELIQLVQRSTVVVLYGQSGLGKTSLLQAGLSRELKALDFLPILLRLDYGLAAPALEEQVKQSLRDELDRANVTAPRPAAGETLWEYFHRRDLDFWGSRNRLLTPVIVLDQFEEIFTLGRKNNEIALGVEQFIAELEALLEHRPPEAVRARLEMRPDDALAFSLQQETVKFVFSLREDFLPHLDRWKPRLPSLLAHRLRLEQMTEQQALDVIVKSGQNLLDPELAADIVQFLAASQAQRGLERRYVEPALLSVVCDELNRRRVERGDAHLTLDLLAGEREEIIQKFYERAFNGIDAAVREWIEDELLTASGYRNRAALEDALGAGLPAGEFDTLVDRRLLHREERAGVIWLELIHDLVTDPAARSRTARAQRREVELSKQREFVAAHELRRARRTNLVFAVLLMLMIAGFAFALIQWDKAADSAAFAESMALRANTANKIAEENFRRAVDLTEQHGLDARRRQIWTATPTLLAQVPDVEQRYKDLLSQRRDGHVIERYAHYLATAAEALNRAGHFDQGHQKSIEAVQVLNRTKAGEVGSARYGLTRAEALRGQADSLIAIGQLKQAQSKLNEAVALTVKSAQDPVLRADAALAQILSKLALARIEIYRLDDAKAMAYLDEAGRVLDESGLEAEPGVMRVTILLQKALASENSAALTLLTESRRILDGLFEGDAPNFVLRRLSSEIDYHRGFTQYRMGKAEEAEQSFSNAHLTNEKLTERDPDNLDWRLALGLSLRGLGMVKGDQAPDLSRMFYDRAVRLGEGLQRDQPSWIRGRFLLGASLLNLGALFQSRAESGGERTEDDKKSDWAAATKHYADARSTLQKNMNAAPQYLYYATEVARVLHHEALVAIHDKRYRAALIADERACAIMEGLPRSRDVLVDGARYRLYVGYSNYYLGRYQEAAAHYRTALTTLQSFTKPSQYIRNEIAMGQSWLASTYIDRKEPENSSAHLTRAVQAIETALKHASIGSDVLYCLQLKATIYRQKAQLAYDQHNIPSSVAALAEAVDAAWKGLKIDYAHHEMHQAWDSAHELGMKIDTALREGKPTQLGAHDRAALRTMVSELFRTADRKQLLENVPSATWTLVPLMPGAWQNVPSEELDNAMKGLGASRAPVARTNILRLRRLSLVFYDNAVLYESEVALPNSERGIVSWIVRGNDTVVIDGTRGVIYALNRKATPLLDTPERVASYLRFFLGALSGKDGRFKLIDTYDDLAWNTHATARQRKVPGVIKPLTLHTSRSGFWQAIGTLQYDAQLFHAIFQIKRDGSMTIETGNPIYARRLPLVDQLFVDRVRQNAPPDYQVRKLQRQLASDPEDQGVLESLARGYGQLKQWSDAVNTQRQFIDYLIRNTTDEDALREMLVSEYLSLSWYQLMSRDFSGALASTEAGKKLDEGNLPLDTNRAHALLFLGRADEAEKLYTSHYGKLIGDQKWEQVILDDFKALEAEGLLAGPVVTRVRVGMTAAVRDSPPPADSSIGLP